MVNNNRWDSYIRDRVVQISVKMVNEPIFEADFINSFFGFRRKRNAKQAMGKIKEYLKENRTQVFDADLDAYFDTIPHDKLMIEVKDRISNTNVLVLINKCLNSLIKDKSRMTGG